MARNMAAESHKITSLQFTICKATHTASLNELSNLLEGLYLHMSTCERGYPDHMPSPKKEEKGPCD